MSEPLRLAPRLETLLTDERVTSFRASKPFPHVVIDAAVGEGALDALRQAIAAEPHWPNHLEIFEMMASNQPMNHPELQRFCRELGERCNLAAVDELLGDPDAVSLIEARSYVYMAGHFLLPHHDFGAQGAHSTRRLAWVLYLSDETAFEGGELELFGAPNRRLKPRARQLVLFEVSERSLHQVREVTSGARCTLAGWFTASGVP